MIIDQHHDLHNYYNRYDYHDNNETEQMTSEGLLWPKLTTWSPLSPYAFQFIQPVCPPIAPICLPIQPICLRIEPVCLRIQPMCLPIQLVWLLSGSLFLMNIIMIHDQHDHHDHHNHQTIIAIMIILITVTVAIMLITATIRWEPDALFASIERVKGCYTQIKTDGDLYRRQDLVWFDFNCYVFA